MANHKRKRPKHQRSGCLLCKGHKDERCSRARKLPPRQAGKANSLDLDTARFRSGGDW